MNPTYSDLLTRLEAAVDAIYELAERYALYKRYHAWTHAYDACAAWKKAVGIAYETAEAIDCLDQVPSEEDIERLTRILFHVRELGKITGKLLSDDPTTTPSQERQ